MHFGENQLSPRSLGISPLPTGHPSRLQPTPVRASTACYGRFTLPMGSSRGFGSTRRDARPFQTRFRSGSTCDWFNRPRRVTRRIMLQKARRHPLAGAPTACKQMVSGSVSLPSPGCFSPFPHGTVRYRSRGVVRLGEWAPQLHTGLLVSGATRAHPARGAGLPLPGSHRLWRRVPGGFASPRAPRCGPAGPPGMALNPVGATAAALARRRFGPGPVRSPLLRACSYFLEVLRCFSSPGALPATAGCSRLASGLPHSETRGSPPASGSPRCIVGTPRPSSAPRAEASPICSFCLPWPHRTRRWAIGVGSSNSSLVRYTPPTGAPARGRGLHP